MDLVAPSGHQPEQLAFAYRSSRTADRALARAAALAKSLDLRLAVFIPFVRPTETGGCCGIRGRQWEQMLREAAQDEVLQAEHLVGGTPASCVAVIEGTSIPEIVANFIGDGSERVLVLPRTAASPFSRRTLRQLDRRTRSAAWTLPAG